MGIKTRKSQGQKDKTTKEEKKKWGLDFPFLPRPSSISTFGSLSLWLCRHPYHPFFSFFLSSFTPGGGNYAHAHAHTHYLHRGRSNRIGPDRRNHPPRCCWYWRCSTLSGVAGKGRTLRSTAARRRSPLRSHFRSRCPSCSPFRGLEQVRASCLGYPTEVPRGSGLRPPRARPWKEGGSCCPRALDRVTLAPPSLSALWPSLLFIT